MLIATKNYLKYPVQTRHIRFWPKEYVIHAIMRVEVYGSRGRSPLLSLLVANKVQSYTVSNSSIVAWTKQIRLNDVNPVNTWCAAAGRFYRLDFGSVKEVRTIFIQGHPTENKWVKKFSLRYSTDGLFYRMFIGYWNTKQFEGNVDRLSITKLNVDPRLAARFLDIHPVEWNTESCMRIEVYGDDDCTEALGMENHLIPNKDIKATSWITIDHNPSQARLHNTHGEGAWCSKIADTKQYLEIRLSRLHKVTRIATQGRFPLPDCLAGEFWVKQYSVEYSIDGYTWQYYKEHSVTKVFTGNLDYINVVVNHFVQPIKAKIVRIHPVQWNQGICIRVELYGCKENFSPVGIENYEIPDSDIRNNLDDRYIKLRLNMPYLPKKYYSDHLDKSGKNFLFINLGYVPFKVTGIAIHGRNHGDPCISKYAVSFSLNDGEWFDYMEEGKQKVFTHDQYDKIGIKVTNFKYEVKARQVRVWSLEHYVAPAFRVEFYGYKVDNSPLGLSAGVIPDSAITVSSQESRYEATNARLNNNFIKAWCASTPINNEFLKVDLGKVAVVSQMAVGRLADGKGRVISFSLSFSLDGSLWEVYDDERTGRKVFTTSDDVIANTNAADRHDLRFPFRARYAKLYPTLYSGSAPCLTLELYGKQDCQDELGVSDWRIPNSAMTASTSISNNYLPWMGRVGSDIVGGAWCARYNDANQFLQIDLGSSHKINSIHIQGKERDTDLPNLPRAWVETFTLSSTEGFNWMVAKEHGVVKVFGGNTNEFEVKVVTVPGVITGRFVRIHPKTWHNHICMRVELIGCEECGEPLGLENFKLPHYALQASTKSGFKSDRARLNRVISSGFCTSLYRVNQFLQIDIGPAGKVVSGVAVQGRGLSSIWITEYSLLYSRDGIDYVAYLEDGKEKIFKGSSSRYDVMKQRLDYTIAVTSVRIVVKEFNLAICFRAELYGCEKCKTSCGFGSQRLSSYSLSASSEHQGLTADKAEVSVLDSAWCAAPDDSSPYLQATFTTITAVSKIVTMGHPVTREYVKIYKLAYSDDGNTWIHYKEDVNENGFSRDITRANAMADGFFHTLQHLIKTKYLRISFASTAGELCLKVALYGHGLCKANLGFEDHLIPDSAFTASSSLSVNHSPAYARVNRHLGHGAWCAKDQNVDQYLQVDLQRPHKVKRLALQAKLKSVGSNDGEAWVKGFSLKYSQDGSQWDNYLDGGIPKAFTGITSKQDTSEYDLIPTLIGQFVRVVISSWQNRICLRMELYGCKVCADPLGIENHKIPDDKLYGSSNGNGYDGRFTRSRPKQWTPNFGESLIYWQVNFGVQKSVTAVVTGGHKYDPRALLQEYVINYSNDGNSWTNYTENSALKIFSGTGEGNYSRHFFSQKITCQYVRILPQKWMYTLRVNVEFYGCDP